MSSKSSLRGAHFMSNHPVLFMAMINHQIFFARAIGLNGENCSLLGTDDARRQYLCIFLRQMGAIVYLSVAITEQLKRGAVQILLQ